MQEAGELVVVAVCMHWDVGSRVPKNNARRLGSAGEEVGPSLLLSNRNRRCMRGLPTKGTERLMVEI